MFVGLVYNFLYSNNLSRYEKDKQIKKVVDFIKLYL